MFSWRYIGMDLTYINGNIYTKRCLWRLLAKGNAFQNAWKVARRGNGYREKKRMVPPRKGSSNALREEEKEPLILNKDRGSTSNPQFHFCRRKVSNQFLAVTVFTVLLRKEKSLVALFSWLWRWRSLKIHSKSLLTCKQLVLISFASHSPKKGKIVLPMHFPTRENNECPRAVLFASILANTRWVLSPENPIDSAIYLDITLVCSNANDSPYIFLENGAKESLADKKAFRNLTTQKVILHTQFHS